ncbi:cupin domain-containing protein [Alkalicoccobacillus gibsonii]|jgi:1,2-dihydroxy-3-keto-5-methylthiopentene dioxygenase|uniref:cupin domain-containing protein n=1 Tax=Alkalicoccobacillus gibsonii TaxID=79881 RepID=UPI001931DAF5|nr:cupin domain-containing protein [Alkalicoccobacillus gibsonii]MBM0067260.1 AraC family ligand binding domain-containing protein [Alkalicoccobacillus gibsonii]
MAVIHIRQTGQTIKEDSEVRAFLESQEVLYEYWDPTKLPERLQNECHLTDTDKEEVLSTFNEDIRSLAERRGYKKWDVIALNEQTPDLDVLLKKFEQVHTHTEDEVRAITAGSGTFVIKGAETGYFDVNLSPGDVISVPVNIPHFFTLSEERQVVAVRLFIDPEGWVAHTFDDPDFKKAQ